MIEYIDIGVFDADPIHLYAFNQMVSDNRRIRLIALRLENDDVWNALNSSSLIMLNMGTNRCCTHLLLQKIVSYIPETPVVCYSSDRKRYSQVVQNHRDRITTVSYGGVIRYLQNFIGLSDDQAIAEDHPFEKQAGAADLIGCLSPRELDVFCLVGIGSGTTEIAGIFTCSVSTIETHIKNLRGKLHLNSSVILRQLAIEYIRSGHCHAISQQRSHICSGRNKTVGTCPFRVSD